MQNPASRHLPHSPSPARFVRVLLPVALVALTSVGCATTDEVRYGNVMAAPGAYDASTYAAPQPLSLGEIVAALRAGRSSHDIADDIDENGLLAPATSADIDLLLQSGADAELIDAVREASSMAARGPASPPVTVAPPMTVSPPVVVTPSAPYYPAPFYPDYGWYPYAPYVPYSYGFWYNDPPRYRYRRDDRNDRRRPDTRRDSRAPGAVAPNWQSPRLPGGGGASPGFTDRQGRQRIPLDSRPNQQWQIPDGSPGVRQTPQPRGSMGVPKQDGGGAVRNRRTIPE